MLACMLVLSMLVPAMARAQDPIQFPALFEQRCAACHENPNPDTQAPSRQTLTQMPADRVYAALTTGVMVENAKGLTDGEIRTLVEGLTGRPAGASTSIAAPAMPNQCSPGTPLGDPLSGVRWNGWSPDATDNARFQPGEAAGLTAQQVPRLTLKWAFGFPGGVSAWGPVTVAGGWLFVGSDNGAVYALDARTGCVHWSFEAKSGVRTAITVGPAKGVAGIRYLAYFADYGAPGAHVYAVDAETGKLVWTVRADDHKQARVLAAPNLDVARGRLYVPVTSLEGMAAPFLSYECCQFRGSIVALDARTGRQVWKAYSIPEPAKPLRKTSTGTQLFGPAGAAVWQTPTRDDKSRVLYFGSGNDYIWPATVWSDAINAVDLDTGYMKWSHQLLPNDVNDGGCGTTEAEQRLNCPSSVFTHGPNEDVAASPILRVLPNGRRVLLGITQSATVTALDPDQKGAVVWQRQAGDGPTPEGGVFGAAADAELLYVPLYYADQTGAMTAIRLSTGERVWYTKVPKPSDCPEPARRTDGHGEGGGSWCSSGQYAAATVIPGVVFAGARDGTLRAYSTRDGRILWEYQTRRAFDTVNGVPAKGGSFTAQGPTVVGGLVFIGSGYAAGGGAAGNVLLAFSVQ
jgi:polyvinyl alcohol dehydrogenase (cytochrome)